MTIRLGDAPGPNRDNVLDLLRTICPEGGLQLNDDGTVKVTTQICRDPNISCGCICQLIIFDRTVTINVDNNLTAEGGGVTFPANPDDAISGNSPSGFGAGTDCEVRIETRNRWRARRADDPTQFTDEPDWLILAHELCGHTLRNFRGDHAPWIPGTPGYNPHWHDQALDAGADIRRERRLPAIIEPVSLK